MENRNKFGRIYKQCKEVSDDLRKIVVDLLIKGGADGANLKMSKGQRQSVERQVGISVNSITSTWRRYASVGTVCRKPHRGGRPKIVQEEGMDFVAWLKTIKPTMSLKSLKDNV